MTWLRFMPSLMVVADEVSLFETATLHSDVAVVDLALARGMRSSWGADSKGVRAPG
jgi:hypothetical protein